MDTTSPNGTLEDESVDECWFTVSIPLSNDEYGTEEEVAQWTLLEDKLETALAETDFAEVDGHEVGEGEFLIWIITSDADQTLEIVKPIVEESGAPEGTRFDVREADDEDFDGGPMRMSLLIPLSTEEGTEDEQARYRAIAEKMDAYLKEEEQGEVDLVYFGEGEAIISATVQDGVKVGEGLQELLSGEDLPEETRIQLEAEGDDEDEEEGENA